MITKRIIPCLDVKDGRVVKGVNFVDLVDAGDPVEAAAAYDAAGADELCFLDITASHEKRGILLDVVRRTAERCFMPVTVGGGVRSVEDIRALLLAGADKASIMSAAVYDRAFVRRAAEKFGDQCIVVAIDAKRVSGPADQPRVRCDGGDQDLIGTGQHAAHRSDAPLPPVPESVAGAPDTKRRQCSDRSPRHSSGAFGGQVRDRARNGRA